LFFQALLKNVNVTASDAGYPDQMLESSKFISEIVYRPYGYGRCRQNALL
jgi:hypothetical protein